MWPLISHITSQNHKFLFCKMELITLSWSASVKTGDNVCGDFIVPQSAVFCHFYTCGESMHDPVSLTFRWPRWLRYPYFPEAKSWVSLSLSFTTWWWYCGYHPTGNEEKPGVLFNEFSFGLTRYLVVGFFYGDLILYKGVWGGGVRVLLVSWKMQTFFCSVSGK